MPDNRWQQIEEFYHEALKRAPATRAAYLAEVCTGDEVMRRKVEALLAYDDSSGDFIEKPALDLAAQAFVEEQTTLPLQLQTGHELGTYQLLELLGRGGMGEVYLALDTRLRRKVAIKLLPARFTTDADRVRRFAQEARAASALNHPNILTIHEIGEVSTEVGNIHYIVTEYVAGETLRQRITDAPNKQLHFTETVALATQIAEALAAAHESGIIHRDIKPENVMVRPDGQVKVLDFGLAKFTEKATNAVNSATQTGIIMGTPGYMSPEQARALKMDGRTDIFSLGVVFYEMIAGRQPFEGATSIDVITAILQQDPAPLTTHNPAVPIALQRIISKALQKDRAARYQTIKELLTDLQEARYALQTEPGTRAHSTTEIIGTETIHYQPDDTTQIEVTPTTLKNEAHPAIPHRRRRWIIGGAAVVMLLGVTFTVPWLSRTKAPPTPVVKAVEQKLYQQMTATEQDAFIGQKAQELSALLGEHATPLNAEAVKIVKYWVEAYAKRSGTGSTRLWAEDLQFLYQRAATQFAPTVIQSFKKNNVPPIVGLYIPLIETEYRNIAAENSAGKAGLFQLLGPRIKEYGFDPSDRTNVEKMADVAAQYIADRMIEFGGDAKSMTLVLYSFNYDPNAIRRDLIRLHKKNPNMERSFWSLLANEDNLKLDGWLQNEGFNYVPRFYAAAIIGEHPKVFGLTIQPLSTYEW